MEIKWRASFLGLDGEIRYSEFNASPTEVMLEKAARAHFAGNFYCIFSSAISNNGLIKQNGRTIASFVVARKFE